MTRPALSALVAVVLLVGFAAGVGVSMLVDSDDPQGATMAETVAPDGPLVEASEPEPVEPQPAAVDATVDCPRVFDGELGEIIVTFRNDDSTFHTITALVGVYESDVRIISESATVENLPGGGISEEVEIGSLGWYGDRPSGEDWECRIDGLNVE